MLFSNETVATAMNASFECAWRSVGPAGRVHVDFGDGRTMERTLGGNIVTWFCLPDGGVVDAQPGVMEADAYFRRIFEAAQWVALLGRKQGAERHARASALCMDAALGWDRLGASIDGLVIQASHAQQDLDEIPPFPTEPASAMIQSFDVAIAKFAAIEDPIISMIGRVPPIDAGDPLEQDSWIAEHQLRPQALAILSHHPLPSITDSEISATVFRTVLHIDPNDPYLGLAPALRGRRDGFVPAVDG